MRLDGDGIKQRARAFYRSLPQPLRRVSVLLLGMAILAAGLAMLVLPGPGLLVMGLAIAVLALEFDWARRLTNQASSLVRDLGRRFRIPR
jgi:uncharacterized protein (TIGR02611 family)